MPIKINKDNGIAQITIDCPPVNALTSEDLKSMHIAVDSLSFDNSIKVVIINAVGNGFPVNALTSEDLKSMHIAVDSLSFDNSIKVVIINAVGNGFCAGADRGEHSPEGGAQDKNIIKSVHDNLWKLSLSIHRCNIPVISSCHGFVIGAGVFIPFSADFSLATKDTYFKLPGIDFKVLLGMAHANRIMPIQIVKKMIFTGESISSKDLHSFGGLLLHKTVNNLALQLTEKDRESLVISKKLLNESEPYKIDENFRNELDATFNFNNKQ